MVQLVRWYMSAFHASRDSDIAKKPYNPILGETFKCYWNAPGYEKSQVARDFLAHIERSENIKVKFIRCENSGENKMLERKFRERLLSINFQ